MPASVEASPLKASTLPVSFTFSPALSPAAACATPIRGVVSLTRAVYTAKVPRMDAITRANTSLMWRRPLEVAAGVTASSIPRGPALKLGFPLRPPAGRERVGDLAAELAALVLLERVAVPLAVGGAQEPADQVDVPALLGDLEQLAPEIGDPEVDDLGEALTLGVHGTDATHPIGRTTCKPQLDCAPWQRWW